MGEVRTLTAMELRSLWGLNQYRHTKDAKVKNRCRLLLGAWIIVILVVFSYVGGLVYGLCLLGLGDIVLPYLVVMASLLVFAFGVFKAGHILFGRQGYEILAAMPIRPQCVVLSRFLAMYAQDLAVTFAVLLPGTIVYGLLTQPNISFYAVVLVTGALVPAIPLTVSSLIGTVILAISSGVKHKSLIQTALMLLTVLAVLVGSAGLGSFAENITPEMLTKLAQAAAEAMGRLYPPAMWLSSGGFWGVLAFSTLSAAVVALEIWLVSRNFHSIMGKLAAVSSSKDYQITAMESRSLLKCLYLREAKRYFASSIYVVNTILGPIMGCVMAGAVCFAGVDAVQQLLPVEVADLLPFVLGGVFSMMTTTAVSISMEGKQFWVVKSLPIPAKDLFDSKILLNLSLMLPFYILSEVFMILALRPQALQLLWLLLIPAQIMVFSVIFGITVNRKLYSFDWEKEEQVVKQSAATALGGFAGPLLATVWAVAALTVPEGWDWLFRAAVCASLAALSYVLYRGNNKTKLEALV